jgi:D-methionine transport system permease protein
LTFITISLIDFSAMAGTVGGGGLGHVAMTYGYQRFDTSVMIVTVVILIVLVQLAQWVGNTLSRKILRR